jgi:hypothetical protein
MKAIPIAVGLLVAAISGRGNAAENSGGFRGPERKGIFPAQGLLKQWPEGGPKLLWQAKVGGGWTGASVAEGRVFFAGGEGENGVMRAFDLEGKELWKTAYGPDKSPRATPAVAGGRVFYESVRAVVHAFDAKTGQTLWSFDLAKIGDSVAGSGGNSGSPLVLGDRVVVSMRSPGDGVASLAALDCATGKVVWQGDLAPTPEQGKGWSGFHGSPVPVRIGERTAVFCNFFRGAGAVWADSGEKFWVDPTVKVKNRVRAQIAANEGYIFLHGTVMAKIGGDGKITPLWEGKVKIAEYDYSYSHTIIRDGKLFAFTPGNVRMLDAETGEQRGSLACARRGTILWADGLLYLMDERPAMMLIEATPEGLRQVSSFPLPLSANKSAMVRLFTPPVVGEGRLFVRDQSRVLVYDLRAGSGTR